MADKIMIVEDEQALVTILTYNLEKAGYDTVAFSDGKEALDNVEKQEPSLILLDWMLPKISGIDLCREIRKRPQIGRIPILLLTARGEEQDKVKGFTAGADDYVTKPFSLPELLVRIKALLRRMPPKPPIKTLCYADIVLDFEKKHVKRGDKLVHLGPTEFKLLACLMKKPQLVFSRENLLKEVWGENIHVELRTVDVHIRRLRRALNKAGEDFIRTVRSSGYSIDISSPVEEKKD
jgi:two-component system, OmpR family, phosphate regulon response regulator PhoB